MEQELLAELQEQVLMVEEMVELMQQEVMLQLIQDLVVEEQDLHHLLVMEHTQEVMVVQE